MVRSTARYGRDRYFINKEGEGWRVKTERKKNEIYYFRRDSPKQYAKWTRITIKEFQELWDADQLVKQTFQGN